MKIALKAIPVSCFLLGLGVGIFAAAAIAWKIGSANPDAFASLLGSFAGALVAIGGSVWLWQSQLHDSGNRVSAASVTICGPLVQQLDNMTIAFGNAGTTSILSVCPTLRAQAVAAKQNIKGFLPALPTLAPAQLVAYIELDQQLDAIVQRVDTMENEFRTRTENEAAADASVVASSKVFFEAIDSQFRIILNRLKTA